MQNQEISTTEETAPEAEKKPLLHRPYLYQTWNQMPVYKDGKLLHPKRYLVVTGVMVQSGEVVRYELLQIAPEKKLTDIAPEAFSELVEKGALVEWSI